MLKNLLYIYSFGIYLKDDPISLGFFFFSFWSLSLINVTTVTMSKGDMHGWKRYGEASSFVDKHNVKTRNYSLIIGIEIMAKKQNYFLNHILSPEQLQRPCFVCFNQMKTLTICI